MYSIEIIIHASRYVGTPHTIELGLHIPMMSLQKRDLGLLEQASWMHPTSSLGDLLAHMCISCMAIPTPHIISIIWPSLAYDCPYGCEPFTPFLSSSSTLP